MCALQHSERPLHSKAFVRGYDNNAVAVLFASVNRTGDYNARVNASNLGSPGRGDGGFVHNLLLDDL